MRVVAALGGNALLRRGEPAEAPVQHHNIAVAAGAVSRLAAEHELLLTHGNGPQVGLLALQAEAYDAVAPYPLDVLGAETEGMIGYLLELELRNRLPGREVASLLTQVLVDAGDPAFAAPTKPVGPVYGAQEAARLAAERGWSIAPDGEHFRRVVPSPEPLDLPGLATIARLVDAGVLVICAGGGGIPVVRGDDGRLSGVEGVIDKDLAAALLAERVGADMLLLLTDVETVQRDWGTPAQRAIHQADPATLRALEWAAGSMGPKVDASCRFVERTGGRAAIGSLAQAPAIVRGDAGTQITPTPVQAVR